MFTSTKKPEFDSISVVELMARQTPIAGAPRLEIKLCYVNSETGHTYGHIDLVHDSAKGQEVLSEKTQKAWDEFCKSLESDQGVIIFGDGKHWRPQMEMFSKDDQAESEEGLGLGGGM